MTAPDTANDKALRERIDADLRGQLNKRVAVAVTVKVQSGAHSIAPVQVSTLIAEPGS